MLGIVVFHMVGGLLMSFFLDERKALEIAGKTQHLRVRGKVFCESEGSSTLRESEENAVL